MATRPSVSASLEVPTRRRLPWIIAAASLALALAFGAYVAYAKTRPLADDPPGRQACATLTDWLNGDLNDPDTGKPLARAYAAAALAVSAAASSTPAIRASAGDDVMAGDSGALLKANGGPGGLRLADLQQLHNACAGAGVKMPTYAEPAG